MEVGVTLALMVGLIQFFSGLLRLDAIADYISQPVLRGYITGAATLVAAGQLANAVGTKAASGNLGETLINWLATLPHTQPLAVAFTLGTLCIVLVLRRFNRRIPGALVAMTISIVVSNLFDLHTQGLRLVSDLAPILKLPRLTTLYLDQNNIQSIQGINALTRLSMLSLSGNGLVDIAPLDGLNSLSSLFLEHNKIANLTPLVNMLKKDADGPKRFAPFLNIYLAGNPAPKSQLSKLKATGARVTP